MEKRAAQVDSDSLRCDKERMTAKVKILEREAQRALGCRAPGLTAEREAESPTAEMVGRRGAQPRRHPVPPNRGASVACAGRGGARTHVGRRHPRYLYEK